MEPYIGEIRLFTWDWAPRGFALCNGALLQISQNVALNSLLGNTYGGDGRTTFGLPDMRGKVPVGFGSSTYVWGNKGGSETVTLTASQVPVHTHAANVINATATTNLPTGHLFANVGQVGTGATVNIYAAVPTPTPNPSPLQTLAAVGADNYLGRFTVNYDVR